MGGVAYRGRLLFRDGMAYAIGEGDKKGDPDGARDTGSVGDVQSREICDHAPDCAVLGQRKLRLARHNLYDLFVSHFGCCMLLRRFENDDLGSGAQPLVAYTGGNATEEEQQQQINVDQFPADFTTSV